MHALEEGNDTSEKFITYMLNRKVRTEKDIRHVFWRFAEVIQRKYQCSWRQKKK